MPILKSVTSGSVIDVDGDGCLVTDLETDGKIIVVNTNSGKYHRLDSDQLVTILNDKTNRTKIQEVIVDIPRDMHLALNKLTIIDQLIRWVDGESTHEFSSNKCCPDQSCCDRNKIWDYDQRVDFTIKYLNNKDYEPIILEVLSDTNNI